MGSLAGVYRLEGKYPKAEALINKTLEIRQRVSRKEHPETLVVMNNLATTYRMERQGARAEGLLVKILDSRRRVLGNKHPYTLATMLSLCRARLIQHKYVEAETAVRPALTEYEAVNSRAWDRYDGYSLLGLSLVGQKKGREANRC
jgi:hypothetical protein